MDWAQLYPHYIDNTTPKPLNESATATTTTRTSPHQSNHPKLTQQVEVADIGCGFGGLLFALAPKLPNTLLLGLEIRTSVTEYVQEKAKALRAQYASSSSSSSSPDSASAAATYQNVSCLRANTMKFLPNFFHHSQLSKIFLCFPDPHFKARKHKARIVSAGLNSEYAFVLRPGGKVYTITDVEDLHVWMVERFEAHASFERVGEEENALDVCVGTMLTETEEGKKVARNQGRKFVAVFRRVEDPAWP